MVTICEEVCNIYVYICICIYTYAWRLVILPDHTGIGVNKSNSSCFRSSLHLGSLTCCYSIACGHDHLVVFPRTAGWLVSQRTNNTQPASLLHVVWFVVMLVVYQHCSACESHGAHAKWCRKPSENTNDLSIVATLVALRCIAHYLRRCECIRSTSFRVIHI